MTGLNTKTDQVLDKFDLVLEKLDAILLALGEPPPTPTATLDDIKAVLDSIYATVLAANTISGRIRDAIYPVGDPAIDVDKSSIMWSVYRIMISTALPWSMVDTGAPYDNGLLNIIGNHVDYDLSAINNQIVNIMNLLLNVALNIGLNPIIEEQEYTGYLAAVLDWLGRISGGIGLPIDANNRNVIELLAKAADRPESQIGSGLAPPDVCSGAYVSSGMTLVPLNVLAVLTPIVFATFPDPPPPEITFGTDFGIGVDNTELHIAGDSWAGWSMYVASSGNNYALNSSDISVVLSRYATNVWLDISFLTDNLSVFVDGGESVRVWLCGAEWGPGGGGGGPWGGGGGGGGGWGDCTALGSVPATYTTTAPFTMDMQVIVLTAIPGLTLTNSWTIGGETNSYNIGNTVATNNMNGVTVTLKSGSGCRVYWVSGGVADHIDINDIDASYTIPVDTTVFTIGNFQVSSPDTSVYGVQICPPGV